MRNSIYSARAGLHSTLTGDYIVEYRGDRTFCQPVPEDSTARWEAESGRGDGICDSHPIELNVLATRQFLADQLAAPRGLNDYHWNYPHNTSS